jgi:SAM-dependent methyltransferase
VSPPTGAPRMDAESFERIYAASEDPWGYRTSEYERRKYADTLAALPARPIGRALESGCSIGVFTELLAARCAQVVAIDFAPSALALARERVGGLPNVELLQASFPEQAPQGPWDVVVCSEVLYYLDGPALLAAARWLAEQLRDGASVLAVSWRGEGSQEPMRGDEAHDVLVRELGSWHTLDAQRSGYRLDRFDGDGR